MPTDLIRLERLRVVAIVGVLQSEREIAQPLECDLYIHVDLTAAGMSDDLNDTVNYAEIADAAVETMRTSKALLLERMAAQVVDAVLAVDERIEAVSMSLRKLRPPVPHDLATSSVSITRRAHPSAGADRGAHL
jgi:dihydroneopterin aldolase